MRTLTRILSLIVPAVVCGLAPAVAQRPGGEKFVKVRAAAPPMVAAGKAFTLLVTVDVEPPFHIQSNKPKEGYIPTEIKFGAVRGLTVGQPVFPSATSAKVGSEMLPAFEKRVVVKVPVKVGKDMKPGKVILPVTVRYQGCNETSCFPPDEVEAKASVNVASSKPGKTRI